jgi:hypothetical protein
MNMGIGHGDPAIETLFQTSGLPNNDKALQRPNKKPTAFSSNRLFVCVRPARCLVQRRPTLNAELVDSVFQCFTWTELRHFSFLDFDGFTCAWVTASASSAGRNGKSAEANQSYGTAFFQLLFNSSDNGIKRAASSSFRDICFGSDVFNEFCFVHSDNPKLVNYDG